MADAGQARLVFYISGASQEEMPLLRKRLELDYSPIERTFDSADGQYLVTQAPLYVEEFNTVVTYLEKLKRLFSKGSALQLKPIYITPDRAIGGTTADDPKGVYIGSGAFVKLLAYWEATSHEWKQGATTDGLPLELITSVNDFGVTKPAGPQF